MADSVKAEDNTRGASPVTVFVSDPSAEAERIAQGLRAVGYVVVDVPLSMLVARVAVQRPRVILIDADSEGALETIVRVRELDASEGIDVVFLGKSDEVVEELNAAGGGLAHESSGFFERPVDPDALVKKVDALTGGSNRKAPGEGDSASIPALRSAAPSLPPPSMRSPEIRPTARATPAPRGSMPMLGSAMELSPPVRKSTNLQAPLSNELEALLEEAEQRVGGQMGHESLLPSPEEEIEAVLPADVLASLDEPLEDDDDEDLVQDAAAGHRGHTTGAGRVTTGGSTGSASTGAGRTPHPPAAASATRLGLDAMPAKTHGGTHVGSTGAGTTGSSGVTGVTTGASGTSLLATRGVEVREVSPPAPPVQPAQPAPQVPANVEVIERRSITPPPMTHEERSSAPRPRVQAAPSIATVLGPGDAPRVLAEAIASRATGVLAFEAGALVRRVVLRDGDVVTTASTADDESLLPFLAARGELPRDRVEQLAGKVPPFGRHAGAALVAHGYLRQDALWTVLRAHAEWVLGRVIGSDAATAGIEEEPPQRIKAEPSVFGASTGAEVLVEAVRRVVAPGVAIARMGGEAARVADGANAPLLSECALGEVETTWLARARGKTIGEAIASASDPDFASVLYALVALGVCTAIAAIGAPPRIVLTPAEPKAPAVDPLDEEAIRARVRGRLQLVEEGDYFAVLGVARDATSYEVKRAFLELRRVFEPSKLLTPGLSDLRGDVQKIASVLDEAYEILRDGARRDRYRKAIDAAPR